MWCSLTHLHEQFVDILHSKRFLPLTRISGLLNDGEVIDYDNEPVWLVWDVGALSGEMYQSIARVCFH
jgi:hypothetical protein